MIGRRRPSLWISVVIALVLTTTAACGGSDEPDGAPVDTAADPTSAEPTTDDAPVETAPEVTAGELDGVAGVSAITITTPASGNGAKPLLAWEPVDGAASYVVILQTTDGSGYWAWTGPDTEVWLGGSDTEPAPDTEGPILYEPMMLSVYASVADGTAAGASETVEIAP